MYAEGAARKAARRGLNVLKARGVPVPDVRRVARVASNPTTRAVEEAWMLPPDGNGTVLMAICVHTPPRRPRAAFVYLNDAVGLQRFETGEVSQSQLKESLVKAAPGKLFKPVLVPIEWARWRVRLARERHREAGTVEPLGLTTAQDLIEPKTPESPPHPFDEEGLVLSDEDANELAANSTQLHRFPEFGTWLPNRAAVDELLAATGEHFSADHPPEQEELKARLEEQVLAATDRYFSPQRRQRLIAWMKDGALSILARDGEQAALEVVAAMKAIERAGLITHPPHEVGFLRAFFDKSLAVLLRQGDGKLQIPVRQSAPSTPEDENEGDPHGASDVSPIVFPDSPAILPGEAEDAGLASGESQLSREATADPLGPAQTTSDNPREDPSDVEDGR
jgi:hypothetical protein